MRVLIAGAGFLGQNLGLYLKALGYEVYFWTDHLPPGQAFLWGAKDCLKALSVDWLQRHPLKAVINLKGASLAQGRWSLQRKKILYDSRLGPTEQLVKQLSQLKRPPEVFLSASGVGVYGAHPHRVWVEGAVPLALADSGLSLRGFPAVCQEKDFLQALAKDWEAQAWQASRFMRTALLRIAPILSPQGGILKRLLQLARWGLLSVLGDGLQWISWMSLRDFCHAVLFLIETPEAQGAFNLAAPETLSQADSVRLLCRAIRQPLGVPVPSWVIQWALGEAGETLLLEGVRTYPQALLRQGFCFEDNTWAGALENALGLGRRFSRGNAWASEA